MALLNGRGQPMRKTQKGSDFATLDQMTNAVWHLYGPLAQTLNEVMERQKALEDHLGFVYVPKVVEDTPPVEPGPASDPS